jgi:hypothetical protein
MDMPIRPFEPKDEVITLLGVLADGVASVVDLLPADEAPRARCRAQWLLCEYASCQMVEIWRAGILMEQISRG